MAARNALKFGNKLKELRVHLCQTSQSSQGLRDFVTNHYSQLKQANPSLPILVRECGDIQPRIWARFEFGQETRLDVTNRSAADILQELSGLVPKSN